MMQFLLYLPPDQGTSPADDPLASEALVVIQEDLEWLLTSDGATFWNVVRAGSNLAPLVDSYLRYASRPYDDGGCQQTPTELAIRLLMLEVLHRAACRTEAGAPSRAERSRLLSRLLNVPKILDLCAIYAGSASPQEAQKLQELVQAAFQLLPNLGSELAAVAGTTAGNIVQVVDACLAAATAAAQAGSDGGDMLQSVLDGVAYLRDVCLTLCALLGTYPPAAAAILSRGHTLMEGLAALHDSLLPAVARLAAAGPGGSDGGAGGQDAAVAGAQLYAWCVHIELASEKAAQLLLTNAYLERGSSGSAAGLAGGGMGPTERGEGLLNCIMVLGHREDEGSSSASGGSGGQQSPGSQPLARALAERHGLGGLVEVAMLEGTVALDEAQAAYLAALLGVSSLAEAPAPAPHSAVARHAGVGSGSGGSGVAGGAAGAAALGGGDGGGVDSAVLASQISQIKDLLPDYGDGYLAVCLDAYDGQPERVIDALLGGSLYPQLAELDPSMTLQQYRERAAAAVAAANDKGKGKRPVAEAAPRPAAPPAQPPSRQRFAGFGSGGASSAAGSSSAAAAQAGGSSAAAAAAAAAAAGGSGSGSGPAGKAKPSSLAAKYLDIREESYRESLISTATAAQWEYDDEYDDSFDELLNYGADGVTEAEEGGRGAAGPSTAGAAGTADPSMAAAQRGMQGLSLGGAGPAAARQPPQQQQQAAQQAQRGGKKGGGKLWVLDGRIYNYAKPGAKEVGSRDEAEQQLVAAQQAAFEIHGLGPGGNKLLPPSGAQQWRRQQQQQGEEEGPGAGAGVGPTAGGRGAPGVQQGGRGGPGRGGQSGGRGGRGSGGPPGSERDRHRYKDAHKSAIGNHHRKDRALKKTMGGMGG